MSLEYDVVSGKCVANSRLAVQVCCAVRRRSRVDGLPH